MRQALAENTTGVLRGPNLALRAYAARADVTAPGFLLRIFLNLIAKPKRQFGSQRTRYVETQLVIDFAEPYAPAWAFLS